MAEEAGISPAENGGAGGAPGEEATLGESVGGSQEAERPDPKKEEENRRRQAVELLAAARANEHGKCMELIENGVPVTAEDFSRSGQRWGTLHWAAIHGNVALVAALLDAGAAAPYREAKDTAAASMGPPSDEVKGLLTNTPLHWACVKGHLRAAWLLLQAGYSLKDVDELGNSALHLAAANGFGGVVRMLIEQGATSTVANTFYNTPLDLATDGQVREALKEHQERGGAGLSASEIARLQELNRQKIVVAEDDLSRLLERAANGGEFDEQGLESLANDLEAKADAAEADNASPALIASARQALDTIDRQLKVMRKLCELEANWPVTTQRKYTSFVNPLSTALKQAKGALPAATVDQAELAIRRGHAEYWLQMNCTKLGKVEIATERIVNQVDKLQDWIARATTESSDPDLVSSAQALLARCRAEIELAAALDAVPTVKLPIEDMPKDYWDPEEEVGHIVETEEYPLPPEEGEYIWEASKALNKLRAANDRLTTATGAAGQSQANEGLLESGTAKLQELLAQLNQLEAKDSTDKDAAVAAATKLAKKLKKKGKGKPKA